MPALSDLRTRLELILSLPSSDSYVSSTTERDDLRTAYEATAYKYDWPQLLVKRGARILANQRKYPTPANFRKFHYLYVLGTEYKETELDLVNRFTSRKYAVDRATDEFIISTTPGSNGTQFTLSGAEAAGQTITIELNSVSGLASGDEIVLPDDGNPEVTYVATVDSAAITITARLDTSKSSGAVMYKGVDNIMYTFYRTVNVLTDATDEPLLPTAIHFIICHYAAYLAFLRLEDFQKAQFHKTVWESELKEYWLAFDKNSTGAVGEFIIG